MPQLVQVVVTLAVAAYSSMLILGLPGPGAIILGGGLALSSTAVAMQVNCLACLAAFATLNSMAPCLSARQGLVHVAPAQRLAKTHLATALTRCRLH